MTYCWTRGPCTYNELEPPGPGWTYAGSCVREWREQTILVTRWQRPSFDSCADLVWTPPVPADTVREQWKETVTEITESPRERALRMLRS